MSYVATSFDIPQLRFNIFGYRGLPFPGDNLENLKEGGNIGDQLSGNIPFRNGIKKNKLGQDMVWPLTLAPDDGTAITPRKGLDLNDAGDWTLPLEPIINIRGGQRVIRRYPSRSTHSGSVKERWSSDDYTIAIKGILLNFSGHDYPEDQVATLRELLEATQLAVSSPLLTGVFGIQRIVIKDFDLAYETGENFQAFRINAWSDQLFDALVEDV